MAIEIPNSLNAAAQVVPSELPDDPFASQRGFLAYDPATNGADPAQIIGGFTKAAVGEYYMKLEEGGDPLEMSALFNPLSVGQVHGQLIPFGVPAPGTLPDGRTLVVDSIDFAGVQQDAPYFIAVFRFATGPNVLSMIP